MIQFVSPSPDHPAVWALVVAPKPNQQVQMGTRTVPTESCPGSSPSSIMSCQRGACKPEALEIAGAETRVKAEKRAVGWAGGAGCGTSLIFPFRQRFYSISNSKGKLPSDICQFRNVKSSYFSCSFRELYLFFTLERNFFFIPDMPIVQ